MLLELHILQNFAPSNLNRDDTGLPKDCEFGGYRRARISSQCFKRAIREEIRTRRLIDSQFLANRTKRLAHQLVERLEKEGKDTEAAKAVVKFVLGGAGLKVGTDDKTEYLLFLGNQEVSNLASLCIDRWDHLSDRATQASSNQGELTRQKAKSARKDAVPAEVREKTLRILDGGKAADLALFGRMLADLSDKNVHAASQVAHAISTNRISMATDYYTAVDDLQPEDTAGAGMIGVVGFNSACFYRYSNVHIEQLKVNLQGDEELATKTLEGFLTASVQAVPAGKQNSMAAHNPPSFVLAVLRKSSLWNLANAFLKPIAPYGKENLAVLSIQALDSYWDKLRRIYGDDTIVGQWALSLEDHSVGSLKDNIVPSLKELIRNTVESVNFPRGSGTFR